ncbi:MAG: prepilin-type N-terminal cleavage/methylation domain-containing protein [Armatimonadetes bacterium]|nr:MAG: prepilin-type N-terminal cleavage/methylation domain-containing protein [Armatimonadota bacterium]
MRGVFLSKLFFGVNSRGFTLVELMVAVGIIAILSLVSISTYSGLQKGTRDSKRQSDLRVIQSALEQYRADQGFYPSNMEFFGSSFGYYLNNSVGLYNLTGNPSPPGPASRKIYLQNIPLDPRNVSPYIYAYVALPIDGVDACDNETVFCTNYCLFARLEGNTTTSEVDYSCDTININLLDGIYSENRLIHKAP